MPKETKKISPNMIVRQDNIKSFEEMGIGKPITKSVMALIAKKVKPIIQESVLKNLAAEGHRVGSWKGLSKRYLRWKKKVTRGRPILELTGTTKKALAAPSLRAYRTVEVQDGAVKIGLVLPEQRRALRGESADEAGKHPVVPYPYMKAHQTGTASVPKRIWFKLFKPEFKAINREVKRIIKEEFKKKAGKK